MKDGVNATPLPTVNTTGYIDHAAFLGTINPDTNKIPKHLFQGYLNIYNNYFKALFFSSRRRHTSYWRDWSSDVCSSDLRPGPQGAAMIDLTVAQIAQMVGGTLADVSPQAAAELRVTGTVEFDSRAVGPGGLFLALPGARSDGHDHAGAAVAAGAVAVLAARPVGVPAIVVPPQARASGGRLAGVLEHDADGSGAAVLAALARLAKAVAAELVAGGLTIVGITGSSGKTSTKDLLAAVLAPLGEVVAPPGSFNNELGHPWTVLRATPSTDYLILELSARHPGNIAALAMIAPPAIGVVLNVGTAHLGEFGSREAIAKTKSELPQSVPRSGVVVLNSDDPAVAAMADVTAARVVRISRHNQTDVWAGPVTLDELARPQFTLHSAEAAVDVSLAVHGD